MKVTKKILVLLIAIMILISLSSIVNAAGSFSLTVSQNSVVVGKTITLTIKTTNAEGKFNITSSNANVVAVETASTWVSGSQGINLIAKSAGTATITVTPVSVSDTDLNLITKPKSVTVTVSNNTQPPKTDTPTNNTKSGDATLKSITIGDKTYSGSTLNNAITYTAGATVGSIKISAVKNNSKATVRGTGTKSLVAGQTNKFQISVTAENGTKKTYTVNIIRLAEESTVPNIIENEGEEPGIKLMLTSLLIKDVDLNPSFNPEIYEYTANVQNIKNIEIDASSSKPEAQIIIEGADKLSAGENLVKIILLLGEEKIEYIIKINNTIQEEIIGMLEDDNNANNKYIEIIKNNWKEYFPTIMCCLLGIISIRYIVLSYTLSRKLKEYEEEEILFDDEEELETKSEKHEEEAKKIGRHF